MKYRKFYKEMEERKLQSSYHNPFRKSVEGKNEGGGDEGIKYKKIGGKKRREMTEKAKVKGREKRGKGKGISSFVVLAIVLSVLAASVATVSAQVGEPEVTGIEVTANPTSIPADGESTSTITATVTWVNQTFGDGFKIHFEILEPDLGAVIGPIATTDVNGVASVNLAAGLTEGVVTVKACWKVGEPDICDETTVVLGEAGDTTPPAKITNLATSNPTSSTIDLTWTALGDDGNTGTATTYDIRYLAGTTPITDANWDEATQCTGEPTPQVAGSSETFTVTGLAAGTDYCFAIKTADEVPNWSPVSNSPSGTTTTPDTTPPSAITDLATSNPTSSSIDLAWTAPGDDDNTGTAATYDIRYLAGTTQITDANWDTATQCVGEPAPQAAGLGETFTVTGLAAGTDYCFAIKTADEVPNWSPVSNSPSGTTTTPDTTPPAAITDLATSNPTSSSIDLTWTAPGDDDNTGTAATYDIRYLAGTTQITDANWDTATQCAGEPAPQAAGLGETFTVTGLAAGTDYCFAIKTADEVPNWSPVSNSPSGTTTTPDTTPPAAITDLATSNPTSSSIDLTWTAPGDDDNTGTAATYDIRYLAGTTQITDANWDTATQCAGEPTPQVAGSSEMFTVTGLAAETDYCFAIKTADEVPNWSTISNSPCDTTEEIPRWDINEDCTVNYIDLAMLSAHWGETTTPPYPRYDINEDGTVNYIDLAILSAHWGETTC